MPTSQHCKNCQSTIQEDENFCSICGQKKVLPPLSLGFLISDFFQSLFSFDSKLPHTLLPLLFHPGKLTLEYIQGRRKQYFSPIKLFLFLLTISLILFTISGEGDIIELKAFENSPIAQENLEAQQYADSILLDIKAIHLDSTIQNQIDTVFYLRKKTNITKDSINVMFFDKNFKIDHKDILTYEFDSLASKYKIEGFWERLFTRQLIKSNTSSNDFLYYFINHISWGILFMIPLLGIMVKLLYIRRSKYLVEHFIFLLHLHSFLLVVLLLDLGLYSLTEYSYNGFIPILLFIIYTWGALHKVYQQSKVKTTLKWIAFFCIYPFMGLLTFLLLLLLTFLLF